MARTVRILLLVLIVAACGGQSSSDAGTQVDAGTPTDAGNSMDAGSPADAGPANITILGAWDDNYGNTDLNCAGDGGTVPSWCYWSINNTLFGEDTVVSYDNTTRSLVTEEYAFSPYNPNTYNKIFWAPGDGGFWWCNSAYDEPDAGVAENSTIPVDSTDPANGGCPAYPDGGGFPWSFMSQHHPAIGIAGRDWHEADGGTLAVTDTSWGDESIVWYDDATDAGAGWAVTKTTPATGAATYNAILWSTSSEDTGVCVLSAGLESAEKAQSDIATNGAAGCTLSSLTQ